MGFMQSKNSEMVALGLSGGRDECEHRGRSKPQVGTNHGFTDWQQSALRAELQRLLRSRELARSRVLCNLLRYLFNQTLVGRADHLTQYAIADDCLGLADCSSESALSLVRSHARRLRRLLNELVIVDSPCRILMSDQGYALILVAHEPHAFDDDNLVQLEPLVLGVLAIEAQTQEGVLLAASLQRALFGELSRQSDAIYRVVFCDDRRGVEHRIRLRELHAAGIQYAMSGMLELAETGWKTVVFVEECATGYLLSRNDQLSAGEGSQAPLAMAEALAAQIVGDWGAIANHLAEQARMLPDEELTLLQTVVLARQYLTHFDFDQLGRCVRGLRRAVDRSEHSAVAATLAVLLNTAGSVEPRWTEALDQREIRALAARAARLGPESHWTKLALAISALLDGRCWEIHEMAKRIEFESAPSPMLTGLLGSMLCVQAIDITLGRKLIARYCEACPNYLRIVHLCLALVALGENDVRTLRHELANYGVPWGWASPLLSMAAYGLEGNHVAARTEWERVLEAFPDFPQRWQSTIGTQWHGSYMRRLAELMAAMGINPIQAL